MSFLQLTKEAGSETIILMGFLDIVKKIYYFLLDFFQTILLFLAVFLVIYIFLFKPFVVNGTSMDPTFHNGEHIITNMIGLRFNDPKLGDVVVFSAPPDPEKDFIKRIIAAQGDRVAIREGFVYLNGQLLDESAYLPPSVRTFPGSFLRYLGVEGYGNFALVFAYLTFFAALPDH